MDRSVRTESFTAEGPDGIIQIPIILPKDQTPISFDMACSSLRGDWDRQNLGYKIRAMQSLGLEVTRALGLPGDPSKIFVIPAFIPNNPCDAGYLQSCDTVLHHIDSLSAAEVAAIVPHEYFHSCQFKLKKLLIDDPSLAANGTERKVSEWFGRDYVSSRDENTPDYLTQPMEFDAFKFTSDFAKKHNLPSREAENGLSAANLAKRKTTREIFADPKRHIQKFANVVRRGSPYISTYKPGGNTFVFQVMNGLAVPGLQAFRRDEKLNSSPSLSNIIAHLAHANESYSVVLMLPCRETEAAMRGHLAVVYKNEMFVHPRYVLESMTPADITKDKIKFLGKENIVQKPKKGVLAAPAPNKSRINPISL